MIKYLLLILLSSNVLASGFFAVEKYGKLPESFRLHEFKHECEEIEGVACYDIAACPLDECEIMTETSNDPETGITIEQKVFKVSEVKKAANEAKKQAEKELELSNIAAKKALKLSIKDDIKTATTVAKLKAVIEKMIEAQE